LNEQDKIGDAIDSLKENVDLIPNTEIVYIDSGSTDKSLDVASSKGVKVVKLLNKIHSPSPSAGRLVGTLVTSSKYIVFVDGDSIVANGWISKALSIMQKDKSIVMLGGELLTKKTSGELFPKTFPKNNLLSDVDTIRGGCAPIILRDALLAVGNWNPFVKSREERDLIIRLKYYLPHTRVCRIDNYSAFSNVSSLTPKEIYRRWKRGFLRGPGQILKNSLSHGYWKYTISISYPIFISLSFIMGLIISIYLNISLKFLIIFIAVVFVRAILTRKYIRMLTFLNSIITGVVAIYDIIVLPAQSAKDYKHDFVIINQ